MVHKGLDGGYYILSYLSYIRVTPTFYAHHRQKLFYRLIKKHEEPKPKRVGELMTFMEWVVSNDLYVHKVTETVLKHNYSLYEQYIREQIENDR